MTDMSSKEERGYQRPGEVLFFEKANSHPSAHMSRWNKGRTLLQQVNQLPLDSLGRLQEELQPNPS